MLDQVAKWLVDSGLLQKILDEAGAQKETPLTAAGVRKVLDDYIQRLMERLDEERLRQLGGGLTQLKDASRSQARAALATQALQSFHEIAALPRDGRTATFDNRVLICLAYLGMAAAHQLLGDPPRLVAEKIVLAVDADPDTADQFLGKETSHAIHRRIAPSRFVPRAGSPKEPDVLFPKDDRWYFVPPDGAPWAHLWIQRWIGPITGMPTFRAGFTHYAAQHLIHRRLLDIMKCRLPRTDAKVWQTKKCGQVDLGARLIDLYAPLSGKIAEVNRAQAHFLNLDILAQDPYGEGWLFRLVPYSLEESAGLFQHVDYQQEFGRLLNAEAYRALLASSTGAGTVSVESIAYATAKGRKQALDLRVTIALVDQLGQPVSGASVNARLRFDDHDVEFAGVTGADGKLTCIQEDAPSATYTLHIDEIQAEGRAWGDHYATPENQYRR